MEHRLSVLQATSSSNHSAHRGVRLQRTTLATVIALAAFVVGTIGAHAQSSPSLQKYVDPLPIPSVMVPVAKTSALTSYVVDARQVKQKLHRDLPPTTVWGYQGQYPGPTFETRYGELVEVTWTNSLPTTHLLPVDHTLPDTMHHQPDVRIVPHRHGGMQPAVFDGVPDAWFTPGQTQFGDVPPEYRTNVYRYENLQDPATLWYHDHAGGLTRLNVYAGLAGFYLIRSTQEDALNLPKGRYEIPLAIQDRTFNADGSLYYPAKGRWPKNHPVWVKHFHGDTAVVNGKVFPYLEVDPVRYRFRILNGCNARFLNLRLSNGMAFNQIGTDVGLLASPVRMSGFDMDPGERVDIVIDFRGRQGQKIRLVNTEGADGPDLPEIMEFRVRSISATDTSRLPSTLRSLPAPDASEAVAVREVTMEHLQDASGDPIAFLLDGKYRHEGVSEIAKAGTTEIWNIVNLLDETHPIHTHLSDFRVLDRQPLDSKGYHEALMAYRDGIGSKPVLASYLRGSRVGPTRYENGNKDTVQAHAASVTRILVRFDEYTGDSVWHCHILEHEDNDMMRPLRVIP
jgi:spore coat protein A, manganese oxidase